ncbi:glycerol-3-phosphate dehydrogenase/oxidase [Microbacterium flavum]|uniref:Glycerol-3-phosphate dehydrogenase/oxidase n=1 Tax=Microbacterium flavum TaxID=415216 RepID=A0ABS5XQK2_9MICO|nr:glycerol-3-phosphate dehydrogenase/oxidase [Microbacterium flavum]MBT8796805.1 glycerol-3-phosphate dehydrogenase/oxidase [Microbacterium flavum]
MSNATQLRPNVQALRERPEADVLIIGGGINGVATFRDLALQGVDVVLVERGDYVSGASSASSHMVHGGVRYLENGEFRLVQEAVVERNALVRNAPHFVKPLPTTIPIHKTFSGILAAPFRLLFTHGRGKPRERGALLIKLGLTMYDTFSRDGGTVPRHTFHGRRASRVRFPDLDPRFAYTATYYDASMHDPERLALDVLRDGQQEGAARSANYVSAVGAHGSAVTLRDEVSGEEFDVTAKVIVNTSGPWTDLTNTALGEPTRFMGGTKGSHIVLENDTLLAATRGNEIFFEASDGRIVLIYPLKGRVMVGTTDIDADPTRPVVCTDDEIEYFFDLIAQVFPDISVTRDQIVYTFSGIRPLPRHDDLAPGFVSRDYRVERGDLHGTPVLSLVGGKWTTFRALSEHVANDALTLLGRPRVQSTANLAIGGGAGYPKDVDARARWVAAHRGAHEAAFADRMLERYGTYAAKLLTALPVTQQPLQHAPGYSREEIAFLAEREEVVTLMDLLLRRTSVAFVGNMTPETLEEIADAAAPALGWDQDRVRNEIEATTSSLRDAHRVDLEHAGVAALAGPGR